MRSAFLFTALALFVLLPYPGPSYALRPAESDPYEILPSAKQYAFVDHTQDHGPSVALAEKIEREMGGYWRVGLWNQWTNTARRVYGSGIEVAPGGLASAADVDRAAREFIAAHPDYFGGAEVSSLAAYRVTHAGDKWVVLYQQTVRGVPVVDGYLDLTFTDGGRLYAFGSNFARGISIPPVPAIDRESAAQIARSALPYDADSELLVRPVETVVLPLLDEENPEGPIMTYRLAHRVDVPTDAPHGLYESYVDAETGEIVQRDNRVEEAYTGSSKGDVEIPSYCAGNTPNVPFANMNVAITGVGTAVTDANGNFSIAGNIGTTTFTAQFDGPVIDVFCDGCPNGDATLVGTISPDSPQNIYFDLSSSRPDERDCFYFVNITNAFLRSIDSSWTLGKHTALVNLEGNPWNCPEAYWYPGGVMAFYNAVPLFGCANTGTVGSVIAHEYGHGIQSAILGGSQGQQGLGEGNADITSTFVVDGSVIGIGVKNCSDGLGCPGTRCRDCQNALTYPLDVVGQDDHDAGRVICGFNWDARQRFEAKYGGMLGKEKIAYLWHFSRKLYGNTSMTQPDQVLDYFLVNDNDGNLGNGTPDYGELRTAATNHGFSCPEILAVSLEANPSSGTAPLSALLTAAVTGTASGPTNFTFWWNCNDPGTSVEQVMSVCGAIPTPPGGQCASTAVGIKCNALTDTIKTVDHIYAAPGVYTAKVIAERGSAPPVEARVQVTVGGLGGRIAFMSRRDGDWEIYLMNADGSGISQLTQNSVNDEGPSWSPDGGSIAFSSDRDGNREIYVMNVDGSGQRRLTVNSAEDLYPDWSPDGSRIAFTSNRAGNFEIYTMKADDGSDLINLTNHSADDEWPDWSPAGDSITFFSTRNGDYEVWIMAANGANPRNLTNNSSRDWLARWSSDGTRIAFSSSRDSGDEEIYVMNADGSNQTRLTVSPLSDHGPSWSADDGLIAFNSTRDGDFEIYIMNADGSAVTQVTDNPDDDRGAVWQPPGVCGTDATPVWSRLITSNTPGPRRQAAWILVPSGEAVVLYGGLSANSPRSDVWQLNLGNPAEWTPLETNPLVGSRYQHSAVSDPVRSRMLVFGGASSSSTFQNDTWARMLVGPPTWARIDDQATVRPPIRYGHTAIYDPDGDRMLIFGGGQLTALLNDTWALALSGSPVDWIAVDTSGVGPRPRYEHSGIYDPRRKRMVIFGGWVDPGGGGPALRENDIWALSLGETPSWSELSPMGCRPSPRVGHTAVYDPARDWMVISGGEVGAGQWLDDVWAFSFADNAWILVDPSGSPPTGRDSHTGILDNPRQRMVVFGGYGAAGDLGDTWAVQWASTGVPRPTMLESAQTRLLLSSPNPFASSCRIDFQLPASTQVRLTAYDASGRMVRSLLNAPMGDGLHTVYWNGTDDNGRRLGPGIYCVRLESSDKMLTRKMVLMK